VPFIAHGDFILDESHAILKYLHAAFGAASHWYPSDLQQRARIDSQVHTALHTPRSASQSHVTSSTGTMRTLGLPLLERFSKPSYSLYSVFLSLMQ
jgi:glutathione S-transferase